MRLRLNKRQKNRSFQVWSSAPLSCTGFSLFEVLLALSIFGIVIVSIIEGVTIQLRAEGIAEDTTSAAILAQNIVEEIRYNEMYQEEQESGSYSGDYEGFSWEYEMEEMNIDGLYKLRVTITWSDGMAERDYTLETFLADR